MKKANQNTEKPKTEGAKTEESKIKAAKGNRKKKWLLWLGGLLFLFFFLWFQNDYLTVSEYVYVNEDLPEEFAGFRMVQISDLHNKQYWYYPSYLTQKVEELRPDCIVLTGDLVDGNRTNTEAAVETASSMVQIAPTYYITGNHEFWLTDEERESLIKQLEAVGVVCLDNSHVFVTRGEVSLSLLGLGDQNLTDGTLHRIMEENECAKITVLLAHEPQYLSVYAREGVDLVFSGHAHGGQFRLPLLGGLVAPDQGFFPEYTEGMHTEEGTFMVISRGIGNSVIPFRLFNLPEIVCVTFERE